MRRLWAGSAGLLLVLGAGVLGWRLAHAGQDAARVRLTVLHTNDIHGHTAAWRGWEGELLGQERGGLARLAGHVRQVREEVGAERVLLLDAGDTLSDTLLAKLTRGKVLLEALGALRYDAMVPGNHEPDFGPERLRALATEAPFPLLAANVKDAATGQRLFAPWHIFSRAGVRVGVLGLGYPNTALTQSPEHVKGLLFEDALEAARQAVPAMRREGAQVIVALTHLGLSADRLLAERVDGIDVIVGGHSHNRMKQPARVRSTLIVQAGAHGSDLGRLDLEVQEGRVVGHTYALLPVGPGPAEPAVAALLERHRAAHGQALGAPAFELAAPLPRAQTLGGQEATPRDAESPADALFADALRESTGAELAFLPGVGYGVALQPGRVSAEALRNLLPHDAPVWRMQLSGAQVRQVLEQALENLQAEDVRKRVGGMVQVSGLRFRYVKQAPRGERVREVRVGPEALPLVPGRTYAVVTNGLLAQGGHAQRTFLQGKGREQVGDTFAMVSAWLARQGRVSPPPAGRIRPVPR